MEGKYLIIIEEAGNGFSAYAPDLPGCIAAAETYEETKSLMREAIQFHIEGMIEDGDSIPEPTTTHAEFVEYPQAI
jgi:predicted RNase H-like HicB family nuclease